MMVRGFCLVLPWVTCCRGSLLLGHEIVQAAMWGAPQGEELRPPACSYVSEPAWKRVFRSILSAAS